MVAAVANNGFSVRVSPAFLAAVAMLVVAAVYWQSVGRMAQMWSLGTYQHGWLVLPIALALLWIERDKLSRIEMRPSLSGFVAVVGFTVAWMLASALNVQAVEFIAVVLLAAAVYWAVAGHRALCAALFPFVLLLFAVPTGEFLVDGLMEITAWLSTRMLYLTGVTAVREGMFISLPGGTFEVARVCAGLRFLLAGLMVSLAFGYMTFATWSARLAFAGGAVLALIIANGIRAYLIMVIASATDMRWLTGDDHIYFGLVVFGSVLAVVLWVGSRFAEPVPDSGEVPGRSSRSPVHGTPHVNPAAAVTALVLLAAGPVSQALVVAPPAPSVATGSLPSIQGCDPAAEWRPDWAPRFRGADQVVSGSYRCGGFVAHVWVAGYGHQEQGRELISSTNRVWPRDWRRYAETATAAVDLNGQSVNVDATSYKPPRQAEQLLWSWYRIGDRVTGSPIDVKLAEAVDALRFRVSRSAVQVIVLEGNPLPASADAEMRRLARAIADWGREE